MKHIPHFPLMDEWTPGQALAARVREMPPAMAAYKGIAAIRAPLLAWLDGRGALREPADGNGSQPLPTPASSCRPRA